MHNNFDRTNRKPTPISTVKTTCFSLSASRFSHFSKLPLTCKNAQSPVLSFSVFRQESLTKSLKSLENRVTYLTSFKMGKFEKSAAVGAAMLGVMATGVEAQEKLAFNMEGISPQVAEQVTLIQTHMQACLEKYGAKYKKYEVRYKDKPKKLKRLNFAWKRVGKTCQSIGEFQARSDQLRQDIAASKDRVEKLKEQSKAYRAESAAIKARMDEMTQRVGNAALCEIRTKRSWQDCANEAGVYELARRMEQG